MKNLLQKYYYKIRIILTFCIVTFILVLIMSRIGYYYLRDVYLTQLSQQAQSISYLLAKQIENKYLNLLQIGIPGNISRDYFSNLMNKYNLPQSKIFIFDKSLTVLVHSVKSDETGTYEPRLLLNQKEIFELEIHNSIATLPFKGKDGNWYLWAFYRLNTNYWLGLQEGADQLHKVEAFSKLFWYIGLIGVFVTIVLGWFVARTITRPIDRLAQFSYQIGKGDFKAKIPKGMRGEIKLLADSMDKMRLDILKSHKDKENMLAQIAHEIRNPLGGIELLANLTKEDILSGKANTEYLDNILKEITELKSLITAYLDYSRPHHAKPEWINLWKFSNEIISLLSETVNKKNIQFKINIINDTILFDPHQLKQVFINLISNSIESIEKNGTILLESTQINENWKLSIKDTGKGIKSGNLSTIFDPFFTTKNDGTGLGLSICRKLCEENNAELIVENYKPKECTLSIIKKVVKYE